MGRISVLVVDDSAVVRKVLTETLSEDPAIEVCGAAPDPIFAMERMARRWPDVIVLDVEMPRMDGITFLKKLMAEHPTPVVAGLRRRLDEPLNLLLGQDVRHGAGTRLGAKDNGRHLMSRILGPNMSSETRDHAEAPRTLRHGSGQPGPFDGQGRTHVRRAPALGERGETLERERLRMKGKPSQAPECDVGGDRVG